MESISSMNMIEGACSLAIIKSSLTIRDPGGEGRGGEGRAKWVAVFHVNTMIPQWYTRV